MISVENFYWVVYENLLKPCEVDAWYYYPFGTKEHLSTEEYSVHRKPLHEHHTLFHFDQEPIWSDDLGSHYEQKQAAWRHKILRILANSERSSLKQQICKQRRMGDWYFFYHGFAALDWFRDCEYVDDNNPIENAFLSLNHNVRFQRSYRISMLARLLSRRVLHKGTVSFHGSLTDVCDEVAGNSQNWCQLEREIVQSEFAKVPSLPLTLDHDIASGGMSAMCGYREYKLWQKSFLHVVNETVFYEPKLHLTEKIFKPIVASRPFVLLGAPGNLQYLRSYGFQTFDHWIDESYDLIQNPQQRLDAVADEVARFCAMPVQQLRQIHHDMRSVLQHNKIHFFGSFKQIIVDELVENFDQCIRIWNNGRVDRRLPLHPDLDRTKRILLS